MTLKKAALLLSLSIISILPAFAQKDTVSLTTILRKTSKLTTGYPIEKVYLHLDKPYYAAGDTIWFKAYLTVDKHSPSNLSKVVYVDITNEENTIIQSLKLPVVNSVAPGNIILSSDLFKEGNYHLRAYTAWMRNFDPDYFFNKNIVIGNSINNPLNTTISFNSSGTGNQLNINTHIIFKDAADAPLANKKVMWRVTANGDDISSGKTNTNSSGIADIAFAGKPSLLEDAILTTEVELADRKTVIKTFPLKTAAAEKDVQFFPEGGELINGVLTKVAFKALNTNGLGIGAKGNVIDNAGKIVANFTSQHLGMGAFNLIPEDGKTYKANVTFTDGTKATYSLPRARPSGVNLAVYNVDTAASITIKISSNSPYFDANRGKPYYIIAQSGGAVYFAAQTALASPVYSAAIPKSKFPTGLVQLTLFNGQGTPVSERVFFIQHHDNLTLNLTADNKVYTTRQRVKIAISAKNKKVPVEGNFSIAVVDESKVPFDENAESSILSNLLLTSDLKGYIEKPNYYFLSKNANAAQDLDILLLTQGYRRIAYSEILAGKYPPVYLLPEQHGIELSGVIRNNTGLPIAKGKLSLQIPAKNFYAETTADMVGNFKFSDLSFPDSSEVIISGRNNVNNKNLMLTANGETYQVPTLNRYVNDRILNIDTAFKPYLQNSKKQYDNSHNLKEVVIKSTTITPRHTDYPSLTGLPPEPDQVLNKDRFVGCQNLLSCLPSMLLGATVENGNIYMMSSYNSNNKLPMQVFVNGLPVDFNYLGTIDGSTVESVEFFKKDGLSGVNERYGTSGIISISLKKIKKTKISFNELQELVPPPYIMKLKPQGYSIVREFYSPKYGVTGQTAFGPDLRTTIYWNPNVTTDKTGAATVDFFNADGRGTYRATIEGFDADGNLGRYVLRYTVK
ncbi:carboxypeptidase regulatory-like domain-containing protein [Mucilaginibacter segetis]|uniref:Carboxypeptidase regulatory-like domain-containing protein n=1 Tax=Mucilaginibacter segetis TaxID=2793071 RepID=A0A934PXJ1_9SPHI|nr:carboxypeptidase regulatory-like domain-containing protein [Mucilaginibacter segetis]MBK0380975.1 carboxypeptidase regulatory-like domain-containing protein [Mucilaginibacter segetis]